MTQKDNGGPAFPLQSIGPDFAPGYGGMSMRDWFAGQFLMGATVEIQPTPLEPEEGETQNDAFARYWIDVAKVAYIAADAMLAEREKSQ